MNRREVLSRPAVADEAVAAEAVAAEAGSAADRGKRLQSNMAAPGPSWTEIITEPDVSDWPVLLHSECSLPQDVTELRESARRRVVDVAQQYVLRLTTAADQAGLSVESLPRLTGDPDGKKIVMTGHQPVIFHGGLTYKYAATEQLANAEAAIGIAVVIDTDTGDPCRLRFPRVAIAPDSQPDNSCAIGEMSLSDPDSIFAFCSFLPEEQLLERVQAADCLLTPAVAPAVAERFRSIMADYQRLASVGVKPSEANLIVRWHHGIGCRLLEIPLSAICSFPEVLRLTAGLLERAGAFAAAYNDQLRLFRTANGIQNEANPFPDLQITQDGPELPFCVLDGQQQMRSRLTVQKQNGTTELLANGRPLEAFADHEAIGALDGLLLRNIQLIPRGALITAFLRLLFADLFVHGTGGGHYDRFTGEFVKSWWRGEASPFVVASASQYLFAGKRDEILRLEALQTQQRDLMYNPQRHFGTGVFSPRLEQQLRELAQEKSRIVGILKAAHARGESAKDIGHQIQKISNRIRAAVADEFEGQLSELTSLTPDARAAIECRTWPWFLR